MGRYDSEIRIFRHTLANGKHFSMCAFYLRKNTVFFCKNSEIQGKYIVIMNTKWYNDGKEIQKMAGSTSVCLPPQTIWKNCQTYRNTRNRKVWFSCFQKAAKGIEWHFLYSFEYAGRERAIILVSCRHTQMAGAIPQTHTNGRSDPANTHTLWE